MRGDEARAEYERGPQSCLKVTAIKHELSNGLMNIFWQHEIAGLPVWEANPALAKHDSRCYNQKAVLSGTAVRPSFLPHRGDLRDTDRGSRDSGAAAHVGE